MASSEKATEENIILKGVKVNNLKNVDLTIPRNKLIVLSGVSGSGKSSLAFDTLYAEGQRRYIESLSAYARQFLGKMKKPEADKIDGLPPAIAIEQRVISRNPRSTVGTTTEIYDYLKLLFARIGRTFSPISGDEVKCHTIEDVLALVNTFANGTRFFIVSPLRIVEGRTLRQQLEMELAQGYTRIIVDNDVITIDEFLESDANSDTDARNILLLIDRMSYDGTPDSASRLTDSCETAFYEGNGEMQLMLYPSMITYSFSTRFEADGMTFQRPSEHLFSFNSPVGACEECEGFGKIMGIDEQLVVPNSTLSVYDGCVVCWNGEKMKWWREEFCRRASRTNFPIFKPYMELSQQEKNYLWHGLKNELHLDVRDRICIDSFFEMIKDNQYKIQYRVMLARFKGKTTCPVCHGRRLKPEAEYVKINGKSIVDLVEMPLDELRKWTSALELDQTESKIANKLLHEINSRLDFLLTVGLNYLTLNRLSNTLSGGESQRINLTTSLGSSLVGSLYVIDEPSIGMHSRDTERLIKVLKSLRDVGNTVVVVEHDEEIIRSADHLIDIGPDAGELGGRIVYQGGLDDIDVNKYPDSYTIKYLSGDLRIEKPPYRRPWNLSIELKGARMNNLKGVDVKFPLNVMCSVTGVSGSGKSSLVKGTLYPALKRYLDEVADRPGEHMELCGDLNMIKHVEIVDQNPIGKSTRSNPVTYVKAYDAIRQLFADQQLSKQMGYTAQYFSFNADGGRCDECKGTGSINVEMQFMADIVLQCECCHGKRFKNEILEVTYEGKNIDDILNMTVSEAIAFFESHKQKQIVNRLRSLEEVGLGYLRLGQNSSTLSGGENQRVKLAAFLGQEKHSPTLFIFDEPTTGLHLNDIKRLLKAFDALILRGHSIIVIEHNLEVIKASDYVIDMGPEGGDNGGMVVAVGTPEEIAGNKKSITGHYLRG